MTMGRNWRALGWLLWLLSCLLALAPARLLTPWLPTLPQATGWQLDGTLWRGYARGWMLPGSGQRLPLSLAWQWHPLGLFSGSLETNLRLTLGASELKGLLRVPCCGLFNGTWPTRVELSDLAGQVAAGELARLLPPPLGLRGQAAWRLERLTLTNPDAGTPSSATPPNWRLSPGSAELVWRQALLLTPQPIPLGEVVATLAPLATSEPNDSARLTISNRGGDLRLDGELRLPRQTSGNYHLTLRIAPRAQASTATQQLLAWLLPAVDGGYLLDQQAPLSALLGP